MGAHAHVSAPSPSRRRRRSARVPVGVLATVVIARDRAGHEDSNRIEREGQNLCV